MFNRDTPAEVWKDIPSYEGRYQVSNKGNVRNASGRMLKPATHRDGYLHVKLTFAGKSRTKFVHRLVAFAFIANPDGDREVDHLDCDKRNNLVGNLEWVSRLENVQRAARHGLLVQPDNKGEKNGQAKVTVAIVREMRALRGTATQAEIGRRFGISRRAVGMILSGERWAHA